MNRGPTPGALADLTLDDRALLVEDTLVLADCHLGRGPSSNVELPMGDGSDVLDRIEALLARHDPATLVVAGDLLHSFRTIPRTVERVVDGIAAATREADTRMVVAPGNHDTMLSSVWDGPTEAEYRVGDTVVCHGHEAPDTEADRYVVGHDHPTITIEGQRRPCYLAGDGVYRGAAVVMVPAFNRLLRGVEVNEMGAADFMSPLLTDVDAFAPVVLDEDSRETLSFPPLGEFRHRL
ncbi:metallophosphoesterase [Salinibaculum rarum]|uniref:metallophosphoesterase n=1 Tax=Salinibaculum rarum TaxID=3058903 RepID=UPI00265E10FC|nr:metallophosphoesterase [Salinibaculum sp. KK48]